MKYYILVLLFLGFGRAELFAQQSQNSISVQGRLISTVSVSGVQVEMFANGVSVSTASPIDLIPDENGVFTGYITGFNPAVFQTPAGLFEVSFKKGDVEIAKTPLTTVPFALTVRGISTGDNIVSVSGNVGIGTITPEKKLSVAGDVLIDGDLYARNLIGAVMFFAGPTCPTGWLLANGANLPTTGVYAALFYYLQYTYGQVGTNFVLPNMTDGSFVRGGTGGNAAPLGVKQEDSFQGHYHNFNSADSDGVRPDMPMNSVAGALGTIQVAGGSQSTVFGSRYITNPRADANGNGTPRTGPETRPRNYSMTPCIKY